jgi:hypothetical protein
MKALWLLSLTILRAASMLATGDAAASRPISAERSANRQRPRSRASLTAVHRPKPLPTSRRPNALPRRPPGVVRPIGPSHSQGRHHGPNPAVVGGSASAHGRNTGTIDGTRLNRKP